MNMKMVEDALKWMEESKAVLTAEEKQKVAWYAFKTEDAELTQKLGEELVEEGCERERVFEKYFAIKTDINCNVFCHISMPFLTF